MTSKAYQYFHYSAFGETLVQEDVNYGKFDAPWRFNGKELDGETGNYYYGARYYNPTWSVWLGVDPLAQEFPSWSSYNFDLNNPVNLVDPDGRAPCPPGVECDDPVPVVDIVSSGASGVSGGTFGMTRSGGTQFHGGLDMRASKGEGLKATLPGTVVYANQNHKSDEYSGRRRGSGTHRPTTGYGNAVVIEYKIENDFTVKGKYGKEDVHLTKGQSVYIKYTHMDNIDVKVGDEVKMGDLLGQAGATGNPGLYKGVWGLPNFENRHTHFEVSTVNQGGFFPKSAIIDPRPFIKTEIDDNGKVLD